MCYAATNGSRSVKIFSSLPPSRESSVVGGGDRSDGGGDYGGDGYGRGGDVGGVGSRCGGDGSRL